MAVDVHAEREEQHWSEHVIRTPNLHMSRTDQPVTEQRTCLDVWTALSHAKSEITRHWSKGNPLILFFYEESE